MAATRTMSESETQSDADSALQLAGQARRHLDIAKLIAADVPDARAEIADHVRAAWVVVHALRSLQAGEAREGADAGAAPELLPEREREPFAAAMKTLLESDPAAPVPPARELHRHLRWLTLALAPAEAKARRAAGLPHPARRPLLALVAVFAAVAAVVVGASIWQTMREDTPPWRLTLYARENLSGRTVTNMHEEIDFRWGNARPVFRIPGDHFSARADSCLVLADATTLEFFLLSDDGSRLYIDGKLALDNWGVHGEKAAVQRLVVEPGTHHLVVEFFDRTQNARLRLGVDDGEGSPLRPDHFRPPTGPADSASPCAP